MTIGIDAEFRALIPRLRDDEREQLERNLQADGCREPLVVWNGVLLDGHNRYEICTRLGIKYATVQAAGVVTRADATLWIVRNQLGRRNISDFVRAELALVAKPLIEAKARANQGARTDLRENSREGIDPVRTDKAIADLAGVSDNTVRKVERIKETAAPELLQAVRAGEVSINAAADIATLPAERQAKVVEDGSVLAVAKEIRASKADEVRQRNDEMRRAAVALPVPEGRYRTIVIDPPWPMEIIDRDVRPGQVGMHYPTMTLDEIKAFALPAAEDAIVYMWTTQRFLPDSFAVLDAWGFKYLVTMVWHKPGGPQPFNLPQYNCEFVVVGRRGSVPFLDTKQFFTCFDAPRREHSRKPDEFYELIRRVSPGPRIDVFSREARDGFDQFGVEADKFGEAA